VIACQRNRLLQVSVLALALSTLAAASEAATADTKPFGLWKTVDDKTGKPRGTVRIYDFNGEVFGKIESSFDPKEIKEDCHHCPGDRKGKPMLGLVILRGLKAHGEEYSGGDILDPDTGTLYSCKIRLIEQGTKLLVRGYLGFSLFGRSQVWLRER
jgi:uncharacterized protein (DUF2147 family)